MADVTAGVDVTSEWVVAASCERGLEDKPVELVVADERHTVLFDGILYERESLERELGLPAGHARVDADLVLAAYGRWGDAAPERLNGTFTILTWDASERALQAVRDRFGIQPLFRYESGATLLFSNSLGALIRDRRVSATVSPIALAALVARRMPYQEETLYARVKRIPQGHAWRRAASGASEIRRYWDPRAATESVSPGRSVDPEEVDRLLEHAVRRRLSGDAMGIYLSGGVDSVAVAAYATALERREGRIPLALSVVIPGEDVDDGQSQRSVASSLDLPQILVPLEDSRREYGILGAALTLTADWPAPLLNPWLPGFLRLNEEAVARGCRTILTGNGGDEWLTTPFFAADLIRARRFRQLGAFASAYRRSYGHSRASVARSVLWRYGLRPLLVDGTEPFLQRRARPLLRLRLRRALPAWMAPDDALRRELFDRPTLLPSTSGRDASFRSSRKVYDHPLQDWDMEELFEASRRSGVRLAHPFCDTDLLALRYRARPEDLNHDGRPKGLLRDAVARRFPDRGLGAQRTVAGSNLFPDLLSLEGPTLLKRMGRIAALGDLGVVDPARFESDFYRVAGDRDSSQAGRMWDVLNLETWVRSHA